MVASFKDCVEENTQSGLFFGNLAHFAEQGTYTPRGGTGVTLTATCDLHEMEPLQDGVSEAEREELIVAICKNPACPRGGVAAPDIGDTYTRPNDGVPWSFQRVLSDTLGEWRLLFARHRPRRYGPRQ